MKKSIVPFVLCMIFGFLLLFPLEALTASKEGLLLWFDTLLPTLLPFLILSQLILKTSVIDSLQKFFAPIFCRLFHCSSNGAFCVLCGFLCGYPVGARLISLSIKEHRLELSEGQYLLGFCNNVSPMFCISYGILKGIGTTQIFPYLCIIYGSALLLSLILRPKHFSISHSKTKKQTSSPENVFQLIDVCIIDSFLILIKLCGYLILFSLIQKGLSMILPATPFLTPFLASILEITNGLSAISKLPPGTIRSAMAVMALSFGGLCCIFQTNSVIADSGLSLKKYTLHKILTALFSVFFCFLWQFFC